MRFEKDSSYEVGVRTGFTISYLVFTTLFYFVLMKFGALPTTWTIPKVILITLAITLVGMAIKRSLK